MKPLRFYEHFACGYGTVWLLMLFVALITRSNIQTGAFGVFGFPIIALVYAFIRKGAGPGRGREDDIAELRRRIAEMEARSGGQGSRPAG